MLGLPPGTQGRRMGPIRTWDRTCRVSEASCKLLRDSGRKKSRNHTEDGPARALRRLVDFFPPAGVTITRPLPGVARLLKHQHARVV